MPPDPTLPPTERQYELLNQALRQTRWNLGLALLLLAGYVAAIAWAISFATSGARQKQEQVLAAVRQRLVHDIKPITEEVGDMAADLTPPVAHAFFGQLAHDLPTLTRQVEQQGKELADHLEATLEKELMARYRAERPRYEAILRQQFPGITDPATYDRMMDRFEAAFRALIRRYHLKEYRARVARTAKLWQEIPPAPASSTRELTDQLTHDLKQWVQYKLVESSLQLFGKE